LYDSADSDLIMINCDCEYCTETSGRGYLISSVVLVKKKL